MKTLKDLRKRNNIKVTQLASLLKMSSQSYYKYEKGTAEPSCQTLITLADFYNVSMDYLFGRQFSNQIGYIPEEDVDLIKDILSMSKTEKVGLYAYVKTLKGLSSKDKPNM